MQYVWFVPGSLSTAKNVTPNLLDPLSATAVTEPTPDQASVVASNAALGGAGGVVGGWSWALGLFAGLALPDHKLLVASLLLVVRGQEPRS